MDEKGIISALIGLTGACNNNPKTENTDHVVIKALAFPVVWPEADYDEAAVLAAKQGKASSGHGTPYGSTLLRRIGNGGEKGFTGQREGYPVASGHPFH